MASWAMALQPVWRAAQDFLLAVTARRKGSMAGMPRAPPTTARARAVVFLWNSLGESMSGRMTVIMVARPAALARLAINSRPSTRA